MLTGATAAGAMIAQLVFGKAARDAQFLSTFSVSLLPAAMICTALLSMSGVIVLSRLMTRHSPARVVPWLFVWSALAFVVECLLTTVSLRVATALFYVHVGVFGATVISSFWSLVNERFDPYTAKLVVGRIASGGTIGGIVGSVIAWRLSAYLSFAMLLLLLSAMNGLCFWGTLSLRAKTSPREPSQHPDQPAPALGLSHLSRTPYLRHLATFIALAGVASSILDYVLAARATEFASGRSLLTFFAIFHMGVALVGFLVQVLVSRISLEKLGVSGTITTLPATVVATGAAALALPGLVTAVLLRASEAVLQNSLFRSGYELLYTPIAPAQKRALKLIIDVGFDRVGVAVGSGLTMAAIALFPASAERLLVVAVTGLGFANVFVSRKLHAGYIRSLEESLRTRSEDLGEGDGLGPGNQSTFLGSQLAPQSSRAPESTRVQPSEPARVNPAPAVADTMAGDQLLAAIQDLRSENTTRIRAVLSAPSLDRRLVAHVIPLLSRDNLAHEVVRVLRACAPRVSGQLVDTLLDPAADPIVRRRIPRALRAGESDVAVVGLTRALADDLFEIRHQAALALAAIAEKMPELPLSRDEVLAAVLREVAVDKDTWDNQRLKDALDDEDEQSASDILRERSWRLEHVFTLLSLVHEREPLKLAFQALGCEDDRLRGTALEYLENVLAPEIRERLWTYLGDLREYRRSARPQTELLDELRQFSSQRRDTRLQPPPMLQKSS
jgi:AAA family ATP:ADP antiporter